LCEFVRERTAPAMARARQRVGEVIVCRGILIQANASSWLICCNCRILSLVQGQQRQFYGSILLFFWAGSCDGQVIPLNLVKLLGMQLNYGDLKVMQSGQLMV